MSATAAIESTFSPKIFQVSQPIAAQQRTLNQIAQSHDTVYSCSEDAKIVLLDATAEKPAFGNTVASISLPFSHPLETTTGFGRSGSCPPVCSSRQQLLSHCDVGHSESALQMSPKHETDVKPEDSLNAVSEFGYERKPSLQKDHHEEGSQGGHKKQGAVILESAESIERPGIVDCAKCVIGGGSNDFSADPVWNDIVQLEEAECTIHDCNYTSSFEPAAPFQGENINHYGLSIDGQISCKFTCISENDEAESVVQAKNTSGGSDDCNTYINAAQTNEGTSSINSHLTMCNNHGGCMVQPLNSSGTGSNLDSGGCSWYVSGCVGRQDYSQSHPDHIDWAPSAVSDPLSHRGATGQDSAAGSVVVADLAWVLR
jgi:hypothetical protein